MCVLAQSQVLVLWECAWHYGNVPGPRPILSSLTISVGVVYGTFVDHGIRVHPKRSHHIHEAVSMGNTDELSILGQALVLMV